MNIFKKLTGGVNFKVSGEVVEGYEPVRKMFEQYFRDGSESRAQVCVYAGGERVVDLHGSIYDDDEFGPDSLIPVFSCSKVNIYNLFVGEAVKIELFYNRTLSLNSIFIQTIPFPPHRAT